MRLLLILTSLIITTFHFSYGQTCRLIISEHITNDINSDELNRHIDWLESNINDEQVDVILHVFSGDNQLSRVGEEKIVQLISSDSLMTFNSKRINYRREFELFTNELLTSNYYCLSNTVNVEVFFTTPFQDTEAQYDFIRKMAVLLNWTDNYGIIMQDVTIRIVDGYLPNTKVLKTITNVK